MIMRSISARYDDGRVLFDEDVVIPSHAKLLVTILEDTDSERSEFLALSAATLANAYDADEVEYFEGDVRK
jgi:hypothetical protein